MKLGAITLTSNDEHIISGTIKCLKPFVDTHIVLLSEKPYYGEETTPDNTEEIARSLGADIVKGTWSLDNFQRTLGNQLLSDCDWIFTLDSDEMITGEDLKKLIMFLQMCTLPAVAIRPEVYWRTTDYCLRPKPTYTPIIATKPNVRFTHIRNIDSPYVLWEGGEMHHLSWCDPKDILKKVTAYAHAPEFDGEAWHRKEYLGWKEGDLVNLPNVNIQFQAIKQPLPEELKQYLYND